MPEQGERAPDFSLRGITGSGQEVEIALSDLRGQRVVLYFYPKDDTSGCTVQACGIRNEWPEFQNTDAVVLGVSPDDVDSHRRFSSKFKLPFTLLSDTDHAVAEAYGVWKERSLYGRKSMGIERSTFIIDDEGRIARAFRRVRPKKHAEQVLEVLGA